MAIGDQIFQAVWPKESVMDNTLLLWEAKYSYLSKLITFRVSVLSLYNLYHCFQNRISFLDIFMSCLYH